MTKQRYTELHLRSAYSFLRGASLPEQLLDRAAELEMPAMALCDRNGLYGSPRFSSAARERGVRPITGCELTMADGAILPVLVENESAIETFALSFPGRICALPKASFRSDGKSWPARPMDSSR